MRVKQLDIKNLSSFIDKMEKGNFQPYDPDKFYEKTFWDKLTTPYYILKNKFIDIRFITRNIFRNTRKYWELIKYDVPWDYESFYFGFISKLKELENTFEFHAHVKDAPIVLKEVRIARILCERILEDDYYEKIVRKRIFNWNSQDKLTHAAYLKKQDKDYLYNLIAKKSESWWD